MWGIRVTELSEKKRFYEEGLRFQCQGCGMCCRLPRGYVEVSVAEASRLADFLSLSYERFLEEYCQVQAGQIRLRENEDKSCVFLQENRCAVYPARPVQCETFPFWPENLKSHYRWKMLKLFCPGIDRGRLYRREEIIKIESQMKFLDEERTGEEAKK